MRLARQIGARVGGAVITLIGVSVVVFLMVRVIPGDPITAVMQRSYDPDVEAALRQLYGLDDPIVTQYFTWLGAILRGDFGFSLVTGASVSEAIAERVPRTLYLMAGGVGFALLVALPFGMLAAGYRGRLPDTVVNMAASFLMSVPEFFLGLVLILIFSVVLGWLPAVGYIDPAQDLLGSLRSMVLPWATLGFGVAAFMARVLRSSLVDMMEDDHIQTARARGLSGRQVMIHHGLRNASLPLVTLIGLEIGYQLGGSIVVERVFAYPGMGDLVVSAIRQRDYPMIQAGILVFATGFIAMNLVADSLYTILDPRVST